MNKARFTEMAESVRREVRRELSGKSHRRRCCASSDDRLDA